MKRSILFLGATLMIMLAATAQMASAQQVDITLVYRNSNQGLQVEVSPWIVNIQDGQECEWNLVLSPPVNVTVLAFWVRGFSRPLPNVQATTVSSRSRGPFKLHPKCAADVDCNGTNSTSVDPPLETYDIILDVVLPGGAVDRVLIDPGHRVRP